MGLTALCNFKASLLLVLAAATHLSFGSVSYTKALQVGENKRYINVTGVITYTFNLQAPGPLTIEIFPCHGVFSYSVKRVSKAIADLSYNASVENVPLSAAPGTKYGTHGISQGSSTRSKSWNRAEQGTYTFEFRNAVPAKQSSSPNAIGEVDIWITKAAQSSFPVLPTLAKERQLHLNATKLVGNRRSVTLYWTAAPPVQGREFEYCLFYHGESAHTIFDVHSSHCGHIIQPSRKERFTTINAGCVRGTQKNITGLNGKLYEFDLVVRFANTQKSTAYTGVILPAVAAAGSGVPCFSVFVLALTLSRLL